jgi:signal transduction histidine kinase/ActR/RegA family two-component response regulator
VSAANEDTHSKAVLVLAPIGNDGELTVEVLTEGGLIAHQCHGFVDLVDRMRVPHGAVVVTEEALGGIELSLFQQALSNQEFWSDIPVILLTSSDGIWATEVFSRSGNISLLERPFSRLTLLRAVEVALRARQRQYHVRSILEQQLLAAQRRDEFFATLSHELRTPLNVILGWLDILTENPDDRAALPEALEILVRNARTQKALIDDLLDISRIITNKLVFEAQPISYGQVLRSTVAGLMPRAKAKGLKVHCQIPAGDFPLLGDDGRVAQVITNLVSNAIKFTSEGGNIWVALTSEGADYVTTIGDDGQGIEPDFLPFIFDRLKQEDMSTTRSHGGLGLGLAISAHIVKEHQGTINAASAGRGAGSVMTLRFPALTETAGQGLSTANLEKSPPLVPLPAATLDGVRVLVVDDSLDILQLVSLWLGKVRAQVQLASSAADALELLPKFQPHVLLSDIGMPGTDGYELIRAVRRLPAERGGTVPAAALTAYARDEERTLALSAGFQLHISKPILKQDLISAVLMLMSDQEQGRGLK